MTLDEFEALVERLQSNELNVYLKQKHPEYYVLSQARLLQNESFMVAEGIEGKVDGKEVLDRLGNTIRYAAILAYEMGFSLEQLMKMNNEKLKQRYDDL